jgi:secondary thiamine-phosphate synthase enzyme
VLRVYCPAGFQVRSPCAGVALYVTPGGKTAGRFDGVVILALAMSVHHAQLQVQTKGKGTYEITEAVQKEIAKSGLRHGTVTVFVQHTSCSLIVMENAAPAARRDLEEFFDRLVPEGADYFEHDDEGPDDMPSHIRMVLTRTSETVPIVDGRMQLGTWQGLFLFEHRQDPHRRTICVTVMGE